MRIPAAVYCCFLLLLACSKEDDSYIPNVIVNFHAPLSDPRISRLNSSGGVATVDNYGVAGLIIYRRPDGGYAAFDRCSPVNPEKRCAVVPDDPSLTATDTCSGAKFSLYDGAPVKAPAVRPLKAYQVSINNSSIAVTN